MLKTRNREKILLNSCIEAKQRFVIDNTNPAKADREKYIQLAKSAKFEVVGYYFESRVKEAISRNNLREGKAKIPELGILGCYGKLEKPSFQEGFDKLYFVRISNNQFEITEWTDEI